MCLSVSDGSLLPVFAHMLGSRKVPLLTGTNLKIPKSSGSSNKLFILSASAKVYSLEHSRMSRQVIEQVNTFLN